MINRLQAASVLMLAALVTVPSLAFPGDSQTRCYQAELFYEDTSYGLASLWVSGAASFLEIEIEGFGHPGPYDVELFMDYYSDLVAGEIKIDGDGDGEEKYKIPFRDPEFTVRVTDGEYTLVSGEWVECEVPEKPVDVKVSPQTLNLKSMGKWVTVKVTVPTDPEPTDFELTVGDGEPLTPSSVKVAPGHVTLKFSRAGLAEICEQGSTEVTIWFKIGDETVELTDVIKVINEGNQESASAHQHNNNQGAASAQQSKNKAKTNNGKAKGKNKGS
jgi:hypothetical protein